MRILLMSVVALSLSSFGLGSITLQADYIDRAKAGKELAGGQLIISTHTQLVATVATEPVAKDKVKIDFSNTHKLKDSFDWPHAAPLPFTTLDDASSYKLSVKLDPAKARSFEELGIDPGNAVLFSRSTPAVGLGVNSVPEPSSLIIWGTALLCLLPWLRKKFSK